MLEPNRHPTPLDAREFFATAFAEFLRRESDLIVSNVSERCLCARLMLYLEALKNDFDFGRYVVDVDYNRIGPRSVKRMLDQGRPVRIESDLLVHRRGVPDNLIALEMKKWRAPRAKKDADRIRLQILTSPPPEARRILDGPPPPEYAGGYVLGLFLVVNPNRRFFDVEEYRGGQLVGPDRYAF